MRQHLKHKMTTMPFLAMSKNKTHPSLALVSEWGNCVWETQMNVTLMLMDSFFAVGACHTVLVKFGWFCVCERPFANYFCIAIACCGHWYLGFGVVSL